MSAANNGKKKPLILGNNTFNFIANMASRSVNQGLIDSDTSKTEDYVSSADSDRELVQMDDDHRATTDSKEINQLENSLKFLKSCDDPTSILTDVEIVNERLDTVKQPESNIEEAESDPESPFRFKLLSKAQAEFENTPKGRENFIKGCKWSPDGTCILTNSDDAVLRIFDCNQDMVNVEQRQDKDLTPSLRMQEPEIIYDYAWYPFMNPNDPITACVFSTCKDNPVHLFDAYTGQIRCSYKGYNHLDELVSAYSIAFNADATKIYCGYKKLVKVFDISIPGKNYQDVKLDDGQFKISGIVSCIAFSQQPNGIYALGSYSKQIGIYVENTNEPVCLIQSHSGGITHLMFSPDGNQLFSGARKDTDINCWDIRNPGKLLQVFRRDVRTNQRIYFDLYGSCKYLASGNYNGTVRFWNGREFDLSKEDEPVLYDLQAHDDCVNGINFHPNRQMMATCCGQRRIFDKETRAQAASSDSESDQEPANLVFENSLKI